MTPDQFLWGLLAPVIGLAVWLLWRWSRSRVIWWSIGWRVLRMKWRLRRALRGTVAETCSDALADALTKDVDKLERHVEDLHK